jgi:DNA (cytosine-5)-methyltransferase 1
MTKNLSTNVQNADSGSTHRFSYRWKLTDLEKVPKNGLRVFSCFSCGGGFFNGI